MLAIIPVACFVLIALVASELARRRDEWHGWRHVFLLAAVVWGALVTVFTEVLSSVGLLTSSWVCLYWVAATAEVAAIYVQLLRERHSDVGAGKMAASRSPWRSATRGWWGYVGVAGAILAVTGILAAIVPPNNWDAMTYHLARVMHWAQDASVTFYPTSIQRQLFDPPWAEYTSLHLYLLSGSDAFTNLIQWFSLLGSCVGVSLIARQLGAGVRGQGLALVFAATIPMAILQASSPQNDFVTTFWVVCLAYFLLCYQQTRSLAALLASGGSLGLALLTKGTAYVYAAPLLLWFGLWSVRTFGLSPSAAQGAGATGLIGRLRLLVGQLWKQLAAIGVPALCLNAAFYIRNLALFASPLGPDGALYSNAVYTPGSLVCTTARDVTLNLATPYTKVNTAIYSATVKLCDAVGSGASDPRTTWAGLSFHINPITNYEGTQGNPIHFLLLTTMFMLCVAVPSLRKRRPLLVYMVVVAGTFGLFCAYLRWQPWGNRLMLPFFLLAAPVVGAAIEHLTQTAQRPSAVLAVRVLACALLCAAIPSLLTNENAPLVGSATVWNTPRTQQYFVTGAPAGALASDYADAAHQVEVAGCDSVGLRTAEEGWEYPLWVMLRHDRWQGTIQSVDPGNTSGRLADSPPFASFAPCAIVTIDTPETGSVLTVSSGTFTRAWSDAGITVFLKR